MKRKMRFIHAFLVAILFVTGILPVLPAAAALADLPETSYGRVVDYRQHGLAPGAEYTWMKMEDDRGPQQLHAVTFDPKSQNLALRAGTKDGKVYGMKGVTEMASYADAPGNRVIAGINGDFYEISGFATGVPNGLFVDEGRILNSGISAYAYGLKADGQSLYGTPILTRTITLGGETVNLTSINRYRDQNQLVLYTRDYHTSTRSSNDGDEFILDIIEGEARSGQTMKMKVAGVRHGAGDAPLMEGQAVLSASGSFRELTAGLKEGDEVSAAILLSGEWADAEVIIGGQGPLIKDGEVMNGVGPAGVHPRTAIGTKADGSIVLLEVDGRSPGFSEGVETKELAEMMHDMGVVNAMNLDGGGSSTFVARLPGEAGVRMMNRGSDGFERKTGNGLLLVNTAPELGEASSLAVRPNAERILQGSSLTFTAAGVDANGHPASVSGKPSWQVAGGLGTVDADGVFTAATGTSGSGRIEASIGEVTGTGEIEVVNELTQLEFPDKSKTYSSNEQVTLSLKALRNGQMVYATNASFEWITEGDIGTVDAEGHFTASSENGGKGRIIARYGEQEASFDVNVGLPPAMLEDFETGLGNYRASSAAAVTVSISEETNPDYVRSGGSSLRLDYDFRGMSGTSGAYLTAVSNDARIQIPGYPSKIGMWVYGDGQKHWLRGQIRDGNNAAVPINYTEQSPGVNWSGWRYVEAEVPPGKATPLTMDMPVRYMETSNANKTNGTIYIDNIRAVYGPLEEDHTPPVFKDFYPAHNEVVKTAIPTITMIAEDDGYDPASHPGTTLIDPDSIRVYVDDQLVEHGLYPPKGEITYKPKTPLSEGRHKIKVAVRDMEGNQSIKEWYFTVNLGSPYFIYETPGTLHAGRTYTLDIRAEKAAAIQEGNISFRFDTGAVSVLEAIKGDKLEEDQLHAEIDEKQGSVRLSFLELNRLAPDDSDLLAQIRYTVRSDVIGPLGQEEAASNPASPLRIVYEAGSVLPAGGSGQPVPFVGPDAEADIRNGLSLTWDHSAIGQGFEASFTVTHTEDGRPATGAGLLFNGERISGAQSDLSGLLKTDEATQAAGTYTLQAVVGDDYSPVMIFKVAPHAGTADPLNVNVTMGEDAARSRHLTWQTEPLAEKTVVEWVKRADYISFEAPNVSRTEGRSSLYNTNNDGTLRVHKAEVTALEPDTDYMYRVGDGEGHMSPSAVFRTSALSGGEPSSFLFIGDSQAGDEAGFALWGETLRKAVEDTPDAAMLVHAGDMVDKGFEQKQWNWWFAAAGEHLMNLTLVPVIGNHEVMGPNGAGDYLAQFHNPRNGAPGAAGTSFSFDAGDTHFVVLDTEQSQEGYEAQAAWLDADLAVNESKWTIIFFHQGPYGSMYVNQRVQSIWVPVFDKHLVDLVMNGHDHIYMRSYPMKGGQVVPEQEGTRYVIGGSSGPKFYALTPYHWQEKIFDKQEQIYTVVETGEDEMTVKAKTLDGTEIDAFTIANSAATAMTLDPSEVQLEPGETVRLTAEITPAREGATILWSVRDDSAAAAVTVDEEGLVTAATPGSATVRAELAGHPAVYAESRITVSDTLQRVELRGRTMLKPGETDRTVTEAVYASGLTVPLADGLRYESSDENVATISGDGTVTALAEGESIMSVFYGDFSDSYRLEVTEEEPVMAGISFNGPARLEAGQEAMTVVEAVYSDGALHPLSGNVRYESDDYGIAEISESGVLRALAEGITTISAHYESYSDSFTLQVTAPMPTSPTPEPTPVPTPTPAPEPTPAATPTLTPTSTPAPSQPPADPAVRTVTIDELQAEAGVAEVTIAVNSQAESVVLPGQAADLLGDASLRVQRGDVALTLPSGVLRQLAELLPDGAASGAFITLTAKPAADDAGQLLDMAGIQAGAQLTAVGQPLDWSLSISAADGTQRRLETFKQALTLQFAVGANVDRLMTGVYYVTESGTLEYAGGRWSGNTISAEIGHFSTYAVLEYDKSFADLPSGHWAESAVKMLAARQLIKGTSTIAFEPGRAITRAEFAAMLARALKLEGPGELPFQDVASDRWYAGAVASTHQAGIVNGISELTFGPEEAISRREMAAMLVRAYAFATGGSQSAPVYTADQAAFADMGGEPEWAKEAISRAASLQLLQGRADGRFDPHDGGTRAESAQMLANLMELIH